METERDAVTAHGTAAVEETANAKCGRGRERGSPYPAAASQACGVPSLPGVAFSVPTPPRQHA